MPNYRSFTALAACAVLAPCRAQTPPAPPAPAVQDLAADRETLADAIRSRDVAKATAVLDADPKIIKMQDRQHSLPLTQAIEYNWSNDKLAMPALLLARGADPNASDGQGRTPLALDLSQSDDPDGKVLDLLVSKGASMTTIGYDGQTPIHTAAFQRKVGIVSRLLARGVSVNLRNSSGNTPLHLAVQTGDPKITLALLNAGADVNLRNNRGDTPLHCAMRLGGLPGNPAALHGRNGFGFSYILDGSDQSSKSIEAMLIAHGAKVDLRDQYGLTPLMYALLNRDDPDRKFLLLHHAAVDTPTAFFQAAALDDVLMMTKLAHANAALPTLRAASGAAPLHVAALWNARRAISWLLKHGAETTDRDSYALCPLHYACRAPDALGAAQDLIAAGASVSAESGMGETPLFYAVRAQAEDTASLLLAHHAAVNTGNESNETPLMVVPNFNHAALVALLLKAGADPNARAPRNVQSVLTSAAASGSAETVGLLLHAGADPNYTSHGDPLPLILAVQSGSKDMVALLLKSGADPRQKAEGQTLLETANRMHHPEIAALLQAKLDATAK